MEYEKRERQDFRVRDKGDKGIKEEWIYKDMDEVSGRLKKRACP